MTVVSLSGDIIDTRVRNDAIVGVLEDVLERARSGEFVSFCIACENFDGTTYHVYEGNVSIHLLGTLEIVKANILQRFTNAT